MASHVTPNEKAVARTLCRQDGFSENGHHEVVDGFTVPGWILYVGLARRLLADRTALAEAKE